MSFSYNVRDQLLRSLRIKQASLEVLIQLSIQVSGQAGMILITEANISSCILAVFPFFKIKILV